MTTWGFEFAAPSKTTARETIDAKADAPDVVKALVKTAISKASEPGDGRAMLIRCEGQWPSDHETSGRASMTLEIRHIRVVK